MPVEPPVARRTPELPARLERFDLTPVELAEGSFEDGELAGADFADASAHDLQLLRVRLVDVNLGGASARGISLREAIVDGGTWANADLQHATLRALEARDVRATGANLGEARLTDVL